MSTLLEAMLDQQARNQQQDMGTLQQAGAVQGLLATQQKQQREAAYRQAIAGAQTPEDQLKVAVQYGGPDAAMKALEMGQQSKERIASAKDALQARLAQQKELADAKLEQNNQFATMMHEYRMSSAKTAEERAAETARHNAQLEVFQKQNAATNEELKRMGLQIQSDKAESQRQNQTQKQVQQLGTALERAGLPESHSVLTAVEEALKKRPDLPDYMSGIKSLAPDALVPNDIAAGRQAFQKMFNIVLKNRSGAAVTVPEFERLKAEFGNGLWKTPEQFRNGLEQARNIISNHYRSVASGFGPEALNGYNQNMREMGGTPLLEPQGESPAGSVPPPPPGFKVN